MQAIVRLHGLIPVTLLLALPCSALAAASKTSPEEETNVHVKPAPAHCSVEAEADDEVQLTASKELNDVVRDYWAIDDSTIEKATKTNVALGVAAGVGLFDDRGLAARLLAGPAVFFHWHLLGANRPSGDVARRGALQLDRLLAYDLPDIARKLDDDLVTVKRQVEDLVTARNEAQGQLAKVPADAEDARGKGSAAPSSSAPPYSPAPAASVSAADPAGTVAPTADPAADAVARERRAYLTKLLTELARQAEDAETRRHRLCVARVQAYRWSVAIGDRADQLNEDRTPLGLGLDFMFGYAFDVATNPNVSKVYSGVMGGVGLGVMLTGTSIGVGALIQEDGLAGPYLSLSYKVLD